MYLRDTLPENNLRRCFLWHILFQTIVLAAVLVQANVLLALSQKATESILECGACAGVCPVGAPSAE